MRDYDKLRDERDLDFKISGQTFTIQPLPLKMIGVWTTREADVNTDDTDAFQQMCVDRIADAVADGNGSEQRWRDLCASEQGPTYGELLELARWVWQAQSDLPTMEPALSAPGRGTTGGSSKAA